MAVAANVFSAWKGAVEPGTGSSGNVIYLWKGAVEPVGALPVPDGTPFGFDSVFAAVRNSIFRTTMRAEADDNAVWTKWKANTAVTPRGSANMRLIRSLIKAEADGAAVWARWSPGVSINGTGNLEINLRLAIAADFTPT